MLAGAASENDSLCPTSQQPHPASPPGERVLRPGHVLEGAVCAVMTADCTTQMPLSSATGWCSGGLWHRATL